MQDTTRTCFEMVCFDRIAVEIESHTINYSNKSLIKATKGLRGLILFAKLLVLLEDSPPDPRQRQGSFRAREDRRIRSTHSSDRAVLPIW